MGYADKMKKSGDLRVCPKKYNERRKVGLHLITERVREDYDGIPRLADELKGILEANNQLKKSLKEPPPPQEFVVGKCPSTVKSGVKARRFWSEAENKVVRKRCKRGMTVWEIALMLVIRTPLQVYDHIRALNKQRVKRGLAQLRVKRRNGKRNVRFTTSQLRKMKLEMKRRRSSFLAEPDSE